MPKETRPIIRLCREEQRFTQRGGHYLMEGGNDRRSKMDAYLTILKTPRSRRQATPVFTGVDPDEAETVLVNYWNTRGTRIRFDH